jgi:hypothetical protein
MSKEERTERMRAVVREMVGIYIGERLIRDRDGARLLGAAMAEHRGAPDAPLDERPTLDAFWR